MADSQPTPKAPPGDSVAPRASAAPLAADTVFWGLLTTQFLGAFNDNYFKQMVLLKCTDLVSNDGPDLQPWALGAFALPFVLLSGLGGYLSDRFSKRRIVVLCKVLEIVVMGAALQVLLLSSLTPQLQLGLLIAVLAFMGAQSAFFGPSKYGILPELFAGNRLLPVNGAIQMTTFIAIIFGMAGAGFALDSLGNSLWLCSIIAVGVAIVGTLTAFLVRPTPVADPTIRLKLDNLFVPRDIRTLFRQDRSLWNAILIMTLFWFIGGYAQPAINTLGENVLQLNKTRTSLMAACVGVGIALGCVIAGFTSRGGQRDGGRWTTRGSWMIVASLVFITILGSGWMGRPPVSAGTTESLLKSLLQADAMEWLLRLAMLLLGLSAGVFVVPIQVFLQSKPPAEQKGRLIGAMNFMTWLGILGSAVYLGVFNADCSAFSPAGEGLQNQYLGFLSLAVFMLPVALFYRLPPAQPEPAEPDKA